MGAERKDQAIKRIKNVIIWGITYTGIKIHKGMKTVCISWWMPWAKDYYIIIKYFIVISPFILPFKYFII